MPNVISNHQSGPEQTPERQLVGSYLEQLKAAAQTELARELFIDPSRLADCYPHAAKETKAEVGKSASELVAETYVLLEILQNRIDDPTIHIPPAKDGMVELLEDSHTHPVSIAIGPYTDESQHREGIAITVNNFKMFAQPTAVQIAAFTGTRVDTAGEETSVEALSIGYIDTFGHTIAALEVGHETAQAATAATSEKQPQPYITLPIEDDNAHVNMVTGRPGAVLVERADLQSDWQPEQTLIFLEPMAYLITQASELLAPIGDSINLEPLAFNEQPDNAPDAQS
jgi:hypothetical protein